jgi:hypothetical protein
VEYYDGTLVEVEVEQPLEEVLVVVVELVVAETDQKIALPIKQMALPTQVVVVVEITLLEQLAVAVQV